MAWLLDIIEQLENYDRTFNILQSVIILLSVMYKLDLLNSLEHKHYVVLFRGLCTIPETGVWSDLVSIHEAFLKDDRLKSELVRILKRIMQYSSEHKKPIIEVMFSFPMLHFAQGVWTPFKPITDYVNFDTSRRAALYHFKCMTVKWYVIIYHIAGFNHKELIIA